MLADGQIITSNPRELDNIERDTLRAQRMAESLAGRNPTAKQVALLNKKGIELTPFCDGAAASRLIGIVIGSLPASIKDSVISVYRQDGLVK